jgi:hypothetical protein
METKKQNKQNPIYMFKLLKARWKAESPEFFIKLKKSAIVVGTSATAVWGVNTVMNLELAEPILTVCKYAIAFCAAVGLTSQLTAKNPEQLNP